MAKQHVRAELYYDGLWNDHTASVRTRSDIQITRGRGDEQGESTPSVCTLTFDNRDGTFNPRNPSSSLYGKIGRNTPLRVSVGTSPAIEDNFNRSVSDAWTGGSFTWTNNGGAAGDYDINGTKAVQTHTDTGVFRRSIASVGKTDMHIRATVNLDTGAVTGSSAVATILARYSDVNNHYQVNLAFNTSDAVTLQLFKRVGGTGSSLSSAATIATAFAANEQFTIEFQVEGPNLRAKAWATATEAEPLAWMVDANDTSITSGTSAALVSRRETGNTNSNLQFQWDTFLAVGGTIRFTGEVSSWTPNRATKGDAWSDVVANGVMRRLGQGSPPSQSPALRAGIHEPTAVGYWPLEGIQQGATSAPSPLLGVNPATISITGTTGRPPTWSDEASLVGSAALPALADEYGNSGVQANISVAGNPAFGIAFWSRVDATKKNEANGILTQATLTLFLTGTTPPRYRLTLLQFPEDSSFAATTAGSIIVRSGSADSTGAGIDTLEVADLPFVDGWRHVYTRFSTSGGDVAVSLWLDGEEIGTDTLTGISLGSITGMSFRMFTQNTTSTEIGRVSFGHPIILSGTTADLDAAAANLYAAGLGHPSETAADRLSRLCDEEGIEFRLVGAASDTEAMGPQLANTILGTFQDCEDTDMGFLYEPRDQLGLVYRTRTSLYNQDAALEIDFDGEEVAPPLQPVVDDLAVRNDITVSMPSGPSARAAQQTGPLSTQAPPDGVGLYDVAVTVNPELDSQLSNIAGWRLNIGTADEIRYPLVTADMDAVPTLDPDASRLDVGDVLLLDNPPDVPDDTSLLVPGYSETIRSHRHTITFNCLPASPYQVFKLGTHRLATSGSTLTNAETTTGTAFELTTPSGALWSTTDEPYDLMVAGEQVTVTTNNDTTSPQDVTVTRSVNGVVKAQTAGTAVQIFPLAKLGL